MNKIDELLAEKEQIRAKLAGDSEMSTEDIDAAEARVKEIDAKVEEIRKQAEDAKAKRAKLIEGLSKADEAGELRTIATMPVNGEKSSIHETTDTSASGDLYRRAWVKDMAKRGGVRIGADIEMTSAERTAFTALTTNTTAVVPTTIQTQIWDLVQAGNAVYGDLSVDNFKNVYEILRHTAIAAGDAAKVAENTAATDDEQNTITAITISGDEFRKSVKLSRKMAVQSFAGFEDWLVREVGNRMGNVLDVYAIAELADATLGMDPTNLALKTTTSGTLTIADVRKLLAALKCDADGYGASKGRVIYANAATIWNYIAAVEFTTGQPAFVASTMDSDPVTQGRIFGVPVKDDENVADGVIYAGYPGCISANLFDGIDITPYIDPTTQEHSYNGYACFGMGVAVPKSFAKMTITSA